VYVVALSQSNIHKVIQLTRRSIMPGLTPQDFYFGTVQWTGTDHLFGDILNGIGQDITEMVFAHDGTVVDRLSDANLVIASGSDGAGASDFSQIVAGWQVITMNQLLVSHFGRGAYRLTLFNKAYNDLLAMFRKYMAAFPSREAMLKARSATLFGLIADFKNQLVVAYSLGDGLAHLNGTTTPNPTSPILKGFPVTISHAVIRPNEETEQWKKASTMAKKPFTKAFPMSNIRTLGFGSDGWLDPQPLKYWESIFEREMPSDEDLSLISQIKDDLASGKLKTRDDISIVFMRRTS